MGARARARTDPNMRGNTPKSCQAAARALVALCSISGAGFRADERLTLALASVFALPLRHAHDWRPLVLRLRLAGAHYLHWLVLLD